MSVLFNVLLPVFLAAGIVALAQQRLRLDIEGLSKAAFYIFSPALVFNALVNSDVSGAEFGQIAAVLVVVTLALWGLGEFAAQLLNLDGPTKASFLIATILMNSANYGLPVTLFAFGEAGVARASLYVTVSTLIRASLCVYIAARGQYAGRQALRQILRVPTGYAALAGLLVNLTGWTVPEPLLKTVTLLAQGTVPALMVVLGVQLLAALNSEHKAENLPALGFVLVGRLILAPLLAYLASGALGLAELNRDVVILESATPSAIMTIILAAEFNTDRSFAALSVFATTITSLLTVTLLLLWLM